MREVFANENFVVSVGGGSETRESLRAKIEISKAKLERIEKLLLSKLEKMKEEYKFKCENIFTIEGELHFKVNECRKLKAEIRKCEKFLVEEGIKGE